MRKLTRVKVGWYLLRVYSLCYTDPHWYWSSVDEVGPG